MLQGTLPPPPPKPASKLGHQGGNAGAQQPLSKGQREKLAKQRKQRANGGPAAAMDLAAMMQSMGV
jgi:hypothetical protein